MNEASLDFTAKDILPEITDTVDNTDNRPHWSLNVSVWCLFLPYFW